MAAKYFLNQTGLQYLINKILYGISAPKYSTSSTYALGALVIYQGNLYRCTTAITVAGAWNASKWVATTAAAELVTINTNLNGLTGILTAGQTSITLSDARITTNSAFYPSTSIIGVNPTGATVATGSITYTFPVQVTDMGVRVVVL